MYQLKSLIIHLLENISVVSISRQLGIKQQWSLPIKYLWCVLSRFLGTWKVWYNCVTRYIDCSFLRILYTDFQSCCANLHSHQQWMRVALYPQPYKYLLSVILLVLAILTGVRLKLCLGTGNLDSFPGLMRSWTLERNHYTTFLEQYISLLHSKSHPYTHRWEASSPPPSSTKLLFTENHRKPQLDTMQK